MAMREFSERDLDDGMEALIDEFLTGSGVLVLRNAFAADQVAEARDLILRYSEGPDTATHFQGANADTLHLQRRVWNLLNKGDVFVEMVQHPTVCAVTGAILGSAFKLGSIAANRLLPGGPGQEPHIDYPYWDFHRRNEFPARMNSSFAMNLQATILLDPFTDTNGATAFLPGSQQDLTYPHDPERFFATCARMTGEPGDVVLFNGMVHHCAMPNQADHDRIGVLIEYLPKFIIQLEDQIRGVDPAIQATASPMLRQLIGVDYQFPELLDEAEAGNTEGVNAG
ncbi:MAG: phytanoyl-CoA dioxygenase family protein [Actinomycetota bacterium]